MVAFKTIRARAAKRKGGEKALDEPAARRSTSPKALGQARRRPRCWRRWPRRIFSAGFVWSVIEQEMAGLRGGLPRLRAQAARCFQPDEFWEGLLSDKRIVRNPQKITAVRENAQFVDRHRRASTAASASSSAQWPADDQIGLLELLAKRGARLGGNTGPVLPALHRQGRLHRLGATWSPACATPASTSPRAPTSKKDLRKIQDQFNAWAKETRPAATRTSRASAPCRSARTTPQHQPIPPRQFRARIAAAAREARRDPASVHLVAVTKTFGAEDIAPGARRRPSPVRREPRAGGQGQVAGAARALPRHRAAPDRPAAVQQGPRGGAAVRCHPHRRPAQDRRGHRRRDGAAGQAPAALHPGQHRRGAAEGRRPAEGGRGAPAAVPRGAEARHRRPHVHPAGRGGGGRAFRLPGQARRAISASPASAWA